MLNSYSPARKIALSVAPNGGTKTKKDHPRIPISPIELAEDAADCLREGAALVHLHVRDENNLHSLDAARYRDAVQAVKQRVGPDMIVQITSESLGKFTVEAQMQAVREVKPEAVSLALREFAPSENEEGAFSHFLSWVRQERILPQIILYTPEEAVRLKGMVRRGLVPWNEVPVLYVLGRYAAGQRSSPFDLIPFLANPDTMFENWTVCAFGPDEANAIVAASLLNGNGRIGFENNLLLPDGSVASDNSALIAVAAERIRACGISLMSAGELRQTWTKLLGY